MGGLDNCYVLKVKTTCIRLHAQMFFSLFMTFGGPPIGVCSVCVYWGRGGTPFYYTSRRQCAYVYYCLDLGPTGE